jgi:hypothetical protein
MLLAVCTPQTEFQGVGAEGEGGQYVTQHYSPSVAGEGDS